MSSMRSSFRASFVCVLLLLGGMLGCNQGADASASTAQAAELTKTEQPAAEPKPAAQPTPAEPAAPTAPAEPPPSAAPAAKLAADSPCAAICTRSTELKCAHALECEAMCTESMKDVTCEAQLKVATACMLAQPLTSWECNDEGVAGIKAGFCDKEQGAFVDCMSAQAPH